MEILLQPLRIPTGWKVEYNDGLFEIDPSATLISPDEHLLFFKEDMLLLMQEDRDRLLDVGWYPEGDLQNGEYAIHLHCHDGLGRLLQEFRTRDRRTLIAEIERVLFAVTEGHM